MTDFSKIPMRCSSIGYFMCKGKEKTPKEKYEDVVKSWKEWNNKYDALADKLKGMKTGENHLAKIAEWEEKMKELEPFKNDEPLPRVAKSYLKKYYAFLKYGKWSASLDKGNKYVTKGKLAEEDSIDLISKLEKKLLIKNEERIANDFLTGEPDLFIGDNILNASYVFDIKTSWDIETFMENLGKDLWPNYWWQMQGYLALTGAKEGEVSYCLVNTPISILNDERYRLMKRLDVATDENSVFKEAEMELVNNMTFDDMPESERRLRFLIKRDDEAIERIYKRVILCRQYLSEVEELHLKGTFDAKSEDLDKNLVESEENFNFASE